MRFATLLLLVLALLTPSGTEAQTVVQSPPVLNRVPVGATDTNPFWQHLVITLTRNPSAGNTITIDLPIGVGLADTDGDGAYDDEVALDDLSSTGTGYATATGTTAGQIVLRSGTGGVSGQVHVQYPITTPSPGFVQAPKYIYWLENGTKKIRRANLDGTNPVDRITGVNTGYGIALDLTNNHIYWADTGTSKIRRANPDGTNPVDIITETAGAGIALDLTNNHIYWTEYDTGKIRRANLDGTNPVDIITGAIIGYGIALDLINNHIYWSEKATSSPQVKSAKIRRANLDGTNPVDLIVTGSHCFSIALDLTNSHIYWTDATTDRTQSDPKKYWVARNIRRANLDGTGVEDLIIRDYFTSWGIALDLTNSHIYWIEKGSSDAGAGASGGNFGTGKLHRANLDGTGIQDLLETSDGAGIEIGSPRLWIMAYGQISFSNIYESSIPAGSLVLSLVEPENLSIATFSRLFVDGIADTTSNAQGDAYPDSAGAVFDVELPDLVSDLRGNLLSGFLSNAGVPYADGSDSNDVQYSFWFSSRDSLTMIDTTVASVALDRNTGQAAQAAEKTLALLAFDTSALRDTTHYLYLTSNLTGNFPLLRSRGIRVQHKPVVLSVGKFRSGDADFLDSGMMLDFDTGIAAVAGGSTSYRGETSYSARSSVDIAFNAVGDPSASVRLFYSLAPGLDTTFVTTSGTAPNRVLVGLTNATDIPSTVGLRGGEDTQLNWNIFTNDTTYVARGNYYVYAVISDGTDIGVTRSAHTYNVRHSPLLIFDSGQDRVLNTGGTMPERYFTITWNGDHGQDGDRAHADSATIALYYSDNASFAVPSGKAALQAASGDSSLDTHLIVSGLQLQPDGRGDNQYIWDLWTYLNPDDKGTPKEDIPYYIYGLVETESISRVVRWNDDVGTARKLTFNHDPYIRPLAPQSSVTAEGRQSLQVEWLAKDVDDHASVWLVLTTAAASLGERTTYAALVADAEPDWLANSSDGSMLNGVPLKEDSTGTHALRPAQLVSDLTGGARPVEDGDYALYLVVDQDGTVPPADSSLAVVVPGKILIRGLPAAGAGGLQAPAMELLPAQVSMTVDGDTTLFELRPHSNGQQVDLVAFFASVDTAFFDIVDQDTAAGVQPFKLTPSLAGIVLRDTLLAGADTPIITAERAGDATVKDLTADKWLLDLVYFEQGGMGNLDGNFVLATMQLVSKEILGETTINVDHLGNRKSAFYRDGEEVALIAPEVAVRVKVLPRGALSGKVNLQGRSDHQSMITLLLRDHNSFLPIGDSLFAAANDLDSTRAGIQDSIGSDGSFSLTQIPRGDYHLAVHFDGFLDGQYPALSIEPGDQLIDINPTFLADGVTDVGYLLGGDVTGYADTSGLQIPDNEIDQLDIDFVASYFGHTVSTTHVGRLADIDGDSLVWVPDLNIVAANFNVDGVAPVFKRVADETAQGAWSLSRRDAGGKLTVEVWADDLEGARAYGYRLHYDPTQLELRSVAPGGAFAARPAVHAVRRETDAVAIGAALHGDQPGLGGPQRLGSFVFAAMQPGAAVEIRDAQWVDDAHRVNMPRRQMARPTAYALSPNFPNPFNPETSMRLHLPQSGQVRLAIFDAAGQRVRTLLSGHLAAGVHVAVWDGRDERGHDVASGNYFARLSAGGVVQVSKMILLR